MIAEINKIIETAEIKAGFQFVLKDKNKFYKSVKKYRFLHILSIDAQMSMKYNIAITRSVI